MHWGQMRRRLKNQKGREGGIKGDYRGGKGEKNALGTVAKTTSGNSKGREECIGGRCDED